MADERGNELFSKYTEDNLSVSSLKKARKRGRGELTEVVFANLPFLVEYMLDQKQSDRGSKWFQAACKTVTSEKYFLDPILKVLGNKKKAKEYEVPEGLNLVLKICVSELSRLYRVDGNASGEFAETQQEHIREAINSIREKIEDICILITKKATKKFMKIGYHDIVALELAARMLPSKYMSGYRMANAFRDFNMALLAASRSDAEAKSIDGDSYVRTLGVDITNPKVLLATYAQFFKGVERKVYLQALTSFMLERRSKALREMSDHQKKVYEVITGVICDVLEGEEVINYDGENIKKKKDFKIVAINKKELKQICRDYTRQRSRDVKHKNDSPRRIIFGALEAERYPKLLDAIRKSVGTDFENSLMAVDEQKPEQKQQPAKRPGRPKKS